jgi:hypothetical protein
MVFCMPDGLVWFQVLQVRHDVLTTNHFGFNKTIKLVSQDYWWPQLWKYVKEFVKSCDVCTWAKNLRHHPHGLLQPLPIPFAPWFSISMDFITYLPLSNSFDSILVVVDHLTKLVHLIPCNKLIIGERTTKLFLGCMFPYFGLLKDVIFYCGPQFASKFWKKFFELLGLKVILSSTFHPQTYE